MYQIKSLLFPRKSDFMYCMITILIELAIQLDCLDWVVMLIAQVRCLEINNAIFMEEVSFGFLCQSTSFDVEAKLKTIHFMYVRDEWYCAGLRACTPVYILRTSSIRTSSKKFVLCCMRNFNIYTDIGF
ncbi:hypothetical protein QQ045_029146 [Rhodiola kirilowii]